MKKKTLMLVAVITALLTAAVTFVGTRVVYAEAFERRCVGCKAATLCLELNSNQTAQICNADCEFSGEAFDLDKNLADERMRLADILEAPDVEDARVMVQVESIISAHDALTDRVLKHVLAMRPYLSLQQQKKLMGLCIDSLKGRWCYRAEMQQAGQDVTVAGVGATLNQVKKSDNAFAEELQRLQKDLQAERNRFAAILSDANSTDEQIRRQMHVFSETHNTMERNVATCVLKIRKTLTVDQQKTLMLMLTRGIRGGA